jgi:anaerobic selenocysteine-containing dehydrogenase
MSSAHRSLSPRRRPWRCSPKAAAIDAAIVWDGRQLHGLNCSGRSPTALRGNIGREGAAPSPVRGNRTCGIDHRPSKQLLDRLEEVCSITPPREHGLDTVNTIKAMLAGDVNVFVSMSGNFSLATPDTEATFAALRSCGLTVQVSTKPNRSHLVRGHKALILPCLGRTEKDVQKTGEQGVTVEDS